MPRRAPRTNRRITWPDRSIRASRLRSRSNGATVKTIKPKPTKAKLFLKQIDVELLRPGVNSLGVSYRIDPEFAEDVTPMPSFIVKLQRQDDPTDSSTKTVLAEIRGPGRPFPSDGEATLSETFAVTE